MKPFTLHSSDSINQWKTILPSFSFFILFLFPALLLAQNLPPGFSQVLITNAVTSPSAICFTPNDGRIFVAEKTGSLRVIKNGVLLPKPFVTLSVSTSGERGLVGVALHPNFSTNKYVYLYYTLASGDHNRIVRYTASGDTAIPGSAVTILDLDPLGGGLIHNAGCMKFGPDGKLYVGVGDATHPFTSQDLDTYHGKILRINADGSVPPGNPYTTGSPQKKRVWVYGLRNPFTFDFQPGTGKLYVNDVGQDTWDEIHDATVPGRNFGWPYVEGYDSTNTYDNPIHYYPHGSGPDSGCAVTGGAFFSPAATDWPSAYLGKYFFVDYCNAWMDMLTDSGSSIINSQFGTGIADYPLALTTGPDGNLYFLSFYNNSVYKIIYNNSQAPVITSHPQSISVAQGDSAVFIVSASGSPQLKYQWRKNGTSIPGAKSKKYKIPAVTPADAGNYSVRVTNSVGNVISNNAVLTVTAPNLPPNATILTPATGATYGGNQVISFSGSATDPEDGNLPASAFSWFVNFHHDSHTHPGPFTPSGVTSGSFTVPVTGETSPNVFYRLYLVVTDSQGRKDTASTDILPRKVNITLNSSPPGLVVEVDGLGFTTPVTFSSVEGILRTISVLNSPQINSGTAWYFNSWSNGKGQVHTFPTPVTNTTFTVNFTNSINLVLNAIHDAHVRSGAFANNNYGNLSLIKIKKATYADGTHLGFIKFDIAGINNNVASAKLRLFGSMQNGVNPTSIVQLSKVSITSWQEKNITWNNKPAGQSAIIAASIVSGTEPGYYEWDLTQLVNSLRGSGIKYLSVLLKSHTTTNSDAVNFNSSENAFNQPELRISYNSPAKINIETLRLPEEEVVEEELLIYPNPTSEYLHVHLSENTDIDNLQVIDINGRVVMQFSHAVDKAFALDVSGLKPGLYILQLVAKDGIINRKFSVQH